MNKILVHIAFLLLCTTLFAQKDEKTGWHLMNYSGYVGLNGLYNNSFLPNDDSHDNYQYGGEIAMSTQSYVWHPNFLTISTSGLYHPQQGEVVSTLMPDYFTDLTNKQFILRADFFKSLHYNINTYMIYDERKGKDRFFDKDIITRRQGADFKFSNGIKINATLEHKDDWEYNNLTNTFREISLNFLRGNIEKSFFKNDKNEFSYNLQRMVSENEGSSKRITNLIYGRLFNITPIIEEKNFNLNSVFTGTKSSGAMDYSSIGFSEFLSYPIAHNLNLNVGVEKNKLGRRNDYLHQTFYKGNATYSLYRSLSSTVNYNVNSFSNSGDFDLNQELIKWSVRYAKKLPFFNSVLTLNYELQQRNEDKDIEDTTATIFREQYQVSDGTVLLLNNVDVIVESIEITDITGSIVYRENIDFIVINQGNRIEIQRLIGGEIQNNSSVYISYDFIQNDSYDYKGDGSKKEVHLGLFGNKIELIYTHSKQEYLANLGSLIGLGLDAFDKKAYRLSGKYKIIGGSIFYEDNQSTAFPYKLRGYSVSANGTIGKKIHVNFIANINDYFMYFREGETNKLTMVSSNFMYILGLNSRLSLNFSYNEQEGDIQNFNLISGRTEFKTKWNQLELSLGVNYFNRRIPHNNYKTQYIGTSFNLKRNF